MTKEKAKLQIKRNLWRWGFKCKDVSEVTDYDLHVKDGDKAFRVKVIDATAEVGGEDPGKARKFLGCDAIAVVTGKRKTPRLYALGSATGTGEMIFETYHDTPLGVFRDEKRKEAEPSC